jgi:hypothetical protein
VPKPASSPLLAIYPVGWLIAAALFFLAGDGTRAEEKYVAALQAVCTRSAQADPMTMSTAGLLEARC